MQNPSPHAASSLAQSYPSQSQEAPTQAEPTEQQQSVPPAPDRLRVFFTVLATIGMLAALFLLQGCNRGKDAAVEAPPAVVSVDAASPVEAAVPTPAPIVYSAGQVVSAATEVAAYGEPSAAGAALELYGPGAAFTVLEPGLDMGAYPILADGQSWVRVRAGDGLAGWVNAAALAR
jgi:hypothetical protein